MRLWRRRMRDVLVWAGAGLLVGALALAVFTVIAAWGRHEDGLLDEAGGWWLLSALIAVLVLAYGVRWGRADPRLPVRQPEGRAYVFWLAVFSVGGVYLAFVGFPTDAFPATVDDARRYDPSPAAAGMWLVVCSVALGCLFMLPSVRAPRLRPLKGSLPSLAAGVLAVVLVSVLMVATVFPRQPDATAGELGDPAPVPSAVGGVGWSWAPPMGAEVEEVRTGSHGPLVLLGDGVVSLDGTTGEELWSFRRPRDWGRSVWADDEHVYVRYAHGTVPEETESDAPGEPIERTTVVLDIGTGEITGEHTVLEPDEWGVFVGVTPEARIERSWADDSGTLVLTGRSLDDGEELWSRTLVEADQGLECRHDEPWRHGDLLLTLHGCAPEKESSLGNGSAYRTFTDLFMVQEDHVEVTVTAMDVTTGQEAWRHEWVSESYESPPERLEQRLPAEEGAAVIALEWRGDEPELIVLDAATGEPLVLDTTTGESHEDLFEPLLEGDGHRRGDVLGVDTTGGMIHENTRDGSLIHRVDAAGEITATADVGDLRVEGPWMSYIAVLDDMVLIPRTVDLAPDEGEPGFEVAVAPFGESVSWEEAQWIEPGGQVLVDTLAVPGAVVVHTGEGEEALVEGLVP